jgi:hypothetical protein
MGRTLDRTLPMGHSFLPCCAILIEFPPPSALVSDEIRVRSYRNHERKRLGL